MKKPFISGKTVIIIAVFWGIVLAIGGVIYGNQAITAPDIESLNKTVLDEKISGNSLNCWITSQRSDFVILEFAKSNQCSTDFSGVKAYACFNEKALKNVKWVRNAFRDLDKQLIVFGTDSEQSLAAAATLKRHGYAVRMLDRNETMELNVPTAPSVNSVIQPLQQSTTTSVNSSAPATSTDEGDFPEEEEEEGC